MNGLLAGSLESLAYEDKLIDETTEKDTLGKMYDDKEYLEFLLGHESKWSAITKQTNINIVKISFLINIRYIKIYAK